MAMANATLDNDSGPGLQDNRHSPLYLPNGVAFAKAKSLHLFRRDGIPDQMF